MTNKINGIDVSEEIRYCNNCSNLGLDFEARKFYCSLSHRPDELPEVLSCDEFSTNCYIKRLQEENEELRQNWRLDCLKCEYKNTKADVDKYKQTLEEIRKIILKNDPECACNISNIIIKKINEVLNDRD